MSYRLPTPTAAERRRLTAAGLCARCEHMHVLRSKTSEFLRCALSDQDPAFPRYPPLPVLTCAGYHAATPSA